MPTTFDLHIHTNRHSPDSCIDPIALLRRAQALGLSGVVITEHDWLWTPEELEQLQAAVPQVRVFAGIEVSCAEGHFLAYGVVDPFRVPKGIGIRELCEEVHRQGGAVVAAHPFRWEQPFDSIIEELRPDLDGLEIMSSNMDEFCRARAAAIRARQRWSGLGSSDAHREETVGCCFSEFPQEIRDLRDLIEAIRSGSAQAKERPSAVLIR
ncbi:MAG: PHP domain-containing protein [Gemmatales bacterium]|nr:PHP domain-containing protein [Gemmatales bacterium]MDW8387157.1 PHP-associated domain-containing protein [Gemmatales bacterium]